MKYKRILLKLSGESLMGNDSYGINYAAVRHYALEIKNAVELGIEVGIVIGGGNIFRGVKGAGKGFNRTQGDYMGMLASTINAMALQTVLEQEDVKVKILSALTIEGIGEKVFYKKAIQYLEEGFVTIFAGGTGNPFFTTDSGAALRAAEIGASLLLKGTRVDGIYSADPEKDSSATKYSSLTFDEVYQKNLNIMDMTAFTICKENNIPIYVFDANTSGNLQRILQGEHIGTIVKID